jgi:uncharacterized protein involved in exopolysaccharide biosynthesis
MSRDSLRMAENRLESFMRANRQYQNSPELSFARERLQRELSLQQQVYTTLVQAYEDARMREVRNTPVIAIVDSATVPSGPDSRGRVRRLALGTIAGAILFLLLLIVRQLVERGRARGDKDLDEIFQEMEGIAGRVRHWIPFRRSSSR